jgi:dephospho-CoA kinase
VNPAFRGFGDKIEMKIIGFVGMPGSGKSVASMEASRMGLKVLVMGDVIRAEAARRGLDVSDAVLGMVGADLRAKEGADAIASRCIAEMAALNDGPFVVDGIRSAEEVELFRSKAESFHLIEVRAPQGRRLERIQCRRRPDDCANGSANIVSVSAASNKMDAAGVAAVEEAGEDVKVFSPCNAADRADAEALERRECRELSWGMGAAIMQADIHIDNDGSLQEFREMVRDLLESLSGEMCL